MKLKNILYDHKKHLIALSFTFIILVLVNLFFSHNDSWYDRTICTIHTVETNIVNEILLDDGRTELHYSQSINAIIRNGPMKGENISITNQYTSSGVLSDKYEVGDVVFVSIGTGEEQILGSITGLKRDKHIALLFTLLFLSIIFVIKWKGFLVIISLLLNIGIFIYALDLYDKGTNILYISNRLVIVFTVISLVIISGFNKKSIVAILSSLMSVYFTINIFKLVMRFSDEIDYSQMDYIMNPRDLPELFLSGLLIVGLGAIIDVCISMSSTINELVEKDNNISVRNLFISGREVGHDIMGTMINVMLFIFISGGIPLTVMKMRSGVHLISLVRHHMQFEIYRFLVGSIGILISIPISLLLSIFIIKKVRIPR